MKHKGHFISFEGGDGAGKTTLITSIEQELKSRGFEVVMTRAPGGTTLGSAIRELLLHYQGANMAPSAELFLFLADRAQHVEEIIRPAVASSKVVLCDRFNDSTVAYQSSARGLDEAFVKELCAMATNHLTPELTLYLDIDPRQALERIPGKGKDRIEAEGLAFHDAIRSAYQKIAKHEPRRFKMLDASRSKEIVFQEAMHYIHAIF